MQDQSQSAEQQQWVIWNGTLGLLDTVTIGEVEDRAGARHAWLDEPYDMVGPFSLDELENQGQIDFAACTVMSRQRWQQDQVELRRQAQINRREYQKREAEAFARYQQRREQHSQQQRSQQGWYQGAGQRQFGSDRHYRELLSLPVEGTLEAAQIKTAYRRLAQKAHPDTGGSHDAFVQITEARDVLLERFG